MKKKSIISYSLYTIHCPLSTNRGFTIIEMLVSIALFSVLSLGTILLISNVLTQSNKQGLLLSDSDQARRLVFQISGELRNAVTSNTGAYTLEQAGDQQLIFYTNLDGGLDIERVRYYIQSGALYKGIVKPAGNPLTYNLGTETSKVVQNDIANGASPLFYYYDGSYNGVSGNPLSQPVNVTQVRFIKASLKIYNKGGVANTNSYTIIGGATIRNLKDNLGN